MSTLPGSPPVASGPPRSTVAGVGIDALSEAEVVAHVVRAAADGRGGRVVTPNLSFIRQAAADPALAELINSADLVVADGAPVVWALRLAGTPVPERVAGSSLSLTLGAPAAEAGVGLFLLGGPPGSGEEAAARLAAAHPGLRTAHHAPPFGFESQPSARRRIDAELAAFGPAIVLCGFGFPRQDRLGIELAQAFPRSWFVGVGASIEFLAGRVERAPLWMQRGGLEWVHRLALDPRRLWGRYRRDAWFALGLFARLGVRRLRSGTQVTVEHRPGR